MCIPEQSPLYLRAVQALPGLTAESRPWERAAYWQGCPEQSLKWGFVFSWFGREGRSCAQEEKDGEEENCSIKVWFWVNTALSVWPHSVISGSPPFVPSGHWLRPGHGGGRHLCLGEDTSLVNGAAVNYYQPTVRPGCTDQQRVWPGLHHCLV